MTSPEATLSTDLMSQALEIADRQFGYPARGLINGWERCPCNYCQYARIREKMSVAQTSPTSNHGVDFVRNVSVRALYDHWWREQTKQGDPQRRQWLAFDAFAAGYEAGLDVMRGALRPADETSDESDPCVSHLAMKDYERALELIRDDSIPQGMSAALFSGRVLDGPPEKAFDVPLCPKHGPNVDPECQDCYFSVKAPEPYCTCPDLYPMHMGHHPDCASQKMEWPDLVTAAPPEKATVPLKCKCGKDLVPYAGCPNCDVPAENGRAE